MGYPGLYSLSARYGSKAIATGFMIFLGEGMLADELRIKIKSHNMGFGCVSLLLCVITLDLLKTSLMH